MGIPQWTSPPSFKISFGITRRPSSAVYMFSAVMRQEVEGILKRFREFLGTCPDLNYRALFSRQAPFYDSVRRHLEEKMPRHCRVSSLAPLLRLTWQELSIHLPACWGNNHEVLMMHADMQESEELLGRGDQPESEEIVA